jgi:hypothetical protein
MDAAWTQRGGGSERIREQNQELDALDASGVIPFIYNHPRELVFTALLRPLRPQGRICWACSLHSGVHSASWCVRGLGTDLQKSSAPRAVLPVRLAQLAEGRAGRTSLAARGRADHPRYIPAGLLCADCGPSRPHLGTRRSKLPFVARETSAARDPMRKSLPGRHSSASSTTEVLGKPTFNQQQFCSGCGSNGCGTASPTDTDDRLLPTRERCRVSLPGGSKETDLLRLQGSVEIEALEPTFLLFGLGPFDGFPEVPSELRLDPLNVFKDSQQLFRTFVCATIIEDLPRG